MAPAFFMPLNIREKVPLAPLTTLRIGGPARLFVEVSTEEEIAEAFEFANSNSLEVFILGGGSNILVADEGIDALVIQVGLKGIKLSDEQVTAAAGEDWDSFVAYCVESDLAGVECLSGIPGFVGGTPVQNVGAYDQEVSEIIVSVKCFDRETSEFLELSNADCGFAYRTSIFNSTHRDQYVVVSVTYALQYQGEPKVVYEDLLEHFGSTKPSLNDVRGAVLAIRRTKSMVIDPNDPNSQSAGSFFKNPIVPIEFYDALAERFGNIPKFAAGEGHVKIPAAWLIEQAGFSKGYIKGRAGISANHTLALINRGNASAIEMIELKDTIQSTVRDLFNIELHPEPIFVGFND